MKMKLNLNFYTFYSYRLIILLMGMTFCYFQFMIHMRNGWDAIYYYAEVHQSQWNSFIHTIFMLGTMTGGFIWVPALFNLNHN